MKQNIGLAITLMGIFGFWDFIASFTGVEILNEVTKDQIMVSFGILLILT